MSAQAARMLGRTWRFRKQRSAWRVRNVMLSSRLANGAREPRLCWTKAFVFWTKKQIEFALPVALAIRLRSEGGQPVSNLARCVIGARSAGSHQSVLRSRARA